MMRTFLDEGKIDFQGDFFQYTGLFTAARPVQERLPLLMGGMKGPRSFIAAGEIADGMHHALSYSREAYDYVGRERPQGRRQRRAATSTTLDIGAWVVTVVAEDSAAAKRAARILVAFYISSMPRGAARAPRHHARRGPAGRRRARRRRRRRRDREVHAPSWPSGSRSPARRRSASRRSRPTSSRPGVNHMILALSDAHLVEFFSGEKVDDVPGVNEQLKLVADRVMPAFS